MEYHTKKWKSISILENRFQSVHSFSQNNSSECKMKNCYKLEDEEKNTNMESSTGSLMIHYFIQSVSSIEDIKATSCANCEKKKRTETEGWWNCDCRKYEMNGYVVVPENTCMNDLVKTVLIKLGYPSCASSFAAGSILIRNWKPLPLESICSEATKKVIEILGELTEIASLRIQFFRPEETVLQKIKDNLLDLLVKTNQSFLKDSGCPFDVGTLSKLCNSNDYLKKYMIEEPPEVLQEKFNLWLKHHQNIEKDLKRVNKKQPEVYLSSNQVDRQDNNIQSLILQKLDSVKSEDREILIKKTDEEQNTTSVKESSSFSKMEKPKCLNVPKTRVRTSFDPEFELPKLHKWFLENPHPSRQQVFEYVSELNSLESRKGRKQLDINNVVYWFKNARAAQKRTECRKVSVSDSNSCNTLKIPLGKSPGNVSEDLRSLSGDETSSTSESGDDYQNESSRCLQVVGKWNANGQGEAVLEMQISGSTNELASSAEKNKKEQINEEKLLRNQIPSTEEYGTKINSVTEKKDLLSDTSEKSLVQKENNETNGKNEIRTNEVEVTKRNQSKECTKKVEVSTSNAPFKNGFIHFKENNYIKSNSFLSPYKSDFSSNPVLGHSFICMSHYINQKPNVLSLNSEERRKRNRTFIDPVTEVPRLEQWFRVSTHPSHNLIARYTEELNSMPYRTKFPKLEAKNVQFWFKNRRAKNKRLNQIETNNN